MKEWIGEMFGVLGTNAAMLPLYKNSKIGYNKRKGRKSRLLLCRYGRAAGLSTHEIRERSEKESEGCYVI